jgi:hypothetical protein
MSCHGKLSHHEVEEPKLGGQQRERKPSCRVIQRIGVRRSMSQIRTILAATGFAASAIRASGRVALLAHEHQLQGLMSTSIITANRPLGDILRTSGHAR